ncbi:hypothetical protein Taro_050310 [Colocasia esculenta]|uniref:RNase H type-1 domain-containing protein n=1 Tax=Colocasia esculenta TaxID=4460 RepID=A0A843XDJ0_COLES|nr:hypothetical protein [Colocasia esculenta]
MHILHAFGFIPLCPSKKLKLIRWIPPICDFSLNVDGACKGNPGKCGGGRCIRDSQGHVQVAFAHFYGVGTNMLAEIGALCDALRLAYTLGYRLSIIYSDSQVLVNSICEEKATSWHSYEWWRDAKHIVSRESISLSDVYRETNQVADSLANYAVNSRQNDVFWGAQNLPYPCKGLVVIDKSSLMHVRMV